MTINQTISLNISKYDLLGAVCMRMCVDVFNIYHINNQHKLQLVFTCARSNQLLRGAKNTNYEKEEEKEERYGLNVVYNKYGCRWFFE